MHIKRKYSTASNSWFIQGETQKAHIKEKNGNTLNHTKKSDVVTINSKNPIETVNEKRKETQDEKYVKSIIDRNREICQNIAWKKRRSEFFLTSSNFAAVAGVSSYNTRAGTFKDKYLGERPKNDYTLRILKSGRDKESLGISEFNINWAAENSQKVESNEKPFDIYVEHGKKKIYCGVTADGFSYDTKNSIKRSIEIKCPENKIYESLYENSPIVPVHHYIQVLSQIKQLDADYGFYVVYSSKENKCVGVKVIYNEIAWNTVQEWISKYYDICVKFETILKSMNIEKQIDFRKRIDAAEIVKKFIKSNSKFFRSEKTKLTNFFKECQIGTTTKKNIRLF
jgi:hypothetical protein